MDQLLSTEYIVSILLSGISLGGQLALIAIGYTMVYGILRPVSYTHLVPENASVLGLAGFVPDELHVQLCLLYTSRCV